MWAREGRISSPLSTGTIDAPANGEYESGCSEVPDVVEKSDVIDEVSQAESSSVDHGETERAGDGSIGGGAIGDASGEIWVRVGDGEWNRMRSVR